MIIQETDLSKVNLPEDVIKKIKYRKIKWVVYTEYPMDVEYKNTLYINSVFVEITPMTMYCSRHWKPHKIGKIQFNNYTLYYADCYGHKFYYSIQMPIVLLQDIISEKL